MSYGWIVDIDHLEDKPVAIFGPADIESKWEGALENGAGVKFQMFDDDEELYYSGRIVGEYDGYEPLDDFGTPDSGCTMIFLDGKMV